MNDILKDIVIIYIPIISFISVCVSYVFKVVLSIKSKEKDNDTLKGEVTEFKEIIKELNISVKTLNDFLFESKLQINENRTRIIGLEKRVSKLEKKDEELDRDIKNLLQK